jgi:hypothetical protein
MVSFAMTVLFRQFAQFLGHSAVIRFFTFAKRQSQLGRHLIPVLQNLINIDGTTGEQLIQRHPFFGRFRVQGKGGPLDGYVKFGL